MTQRITSPVSTPGLRPTPQGAPQPAPAPTKAEFVARELDKLNVSGAARDKEKARLETLFDQADVDHSGTAETAELSVLADKVRKAQELSKAVEAMKAQATQQGDAIQQAARAAESGNVVSRGFNSVVNFFNHKEDKLDVAAEAAAHVYQGELTRDLDRFHDMLIDAGDDPAKIKAAQDFLQGAMTKAQAATQDFDAKKGDLARSNKFWSGLAADVGAGLLVLGGAAIAATGFGAPIGAGMIAAGFAAGGAATVGGHMLLDNQYDFKKEALANFLVGGISSAAMIATAGASSAASATLGQTVARQAVTQGAVGAATSSAGAIAQEAAGGFQEGWEKRVALSTAIGAGGGALVGGGAGAIATRLPSAAGNALVNRAVQVGMGAGSGAVGSGGASFVNEALDGFKDGWQDRVQEQTLGGAIAGTAFAFGPQLHGPAQAKPIENAEPAPGSRPPGAEPAPGSRPPAAGGRPSLAAPEFGAKAQKLVGKEFDLNLPKSGDPKGRQVKAVLTGVGDDGSLHFTFTENGQVKARAVDPTELAGFQAKNPGFVQEAVPTPPPVRSKVLAAPELAAQSKELLFKEMELTLPKSGDPKGRQVKGSLVGIGDDGSLTFGFHEDGVFKRRQVTPTELGDFQAKNPEFVRLALQGRSQPFAISELGNVVVQRSAGGGVVSEDGWRVQGMTPDGQVQVAKDLGSGAMQYKEYAPERFLELNPQLGVKDVQAFLAAGGLKELPPVANAVHVDPRKANVAKLYDVSGQEGRIAVNRAHNQQLAERRYARLNEAERQWVDQVKASSPTRAERVMVDRALGAGHSLEEIRQYANDMRAVSAGNYAAAGITDPAWHGYLNRLSPDQRILALSTLEGHQQFFTTSCNPTAYQVVRGEVDPIFSWQGRKNPGRLISEQRDILVRNNANNPDVAVPRYAGQQGGVGTYPEALARQLNGSGLGIEYRAENLSRQAGNHTTPQDRARALLDIERSLQAGRPTEIYVQWADGAGNLFDPRTGQSYGAHAIAVVDTRTLPDGTKQFLLHDPEFVGHDGLTNWVSFNDLQAGHLGANYRAIGELYSYLSTKDVT